MTVGVYTKKPYNEYVLVSISPKTGHGDIDANDLNQLRKAVVDYWNSPRDLIRIGRSDPKHRFNIGYVGFDRSAGIYFWVDPNGVCKAFNPKTGKLVKVMPLPAIARKLIYEEETWELKEGYTNKRSVKRRA